MKKCIFITITMLLLMGCHVDPYEQGVCKVFYDNISDLPGQSVIVKVIDQNSHTDQHTLTPAGDSLILPLDNGYSYYLRIDWQRVDSIYNIVIKRSGIDNEHVDSYSFMFNDSNHDQVNNIIRISL